MNLKDLILEALDSKEKELVDRCFYDSQEHDCRELIIHFNSFLRELRTICKIAPDDKPKPPPLNPKDFHRLQIERAKEEFRNRDLSPEEKQIRGLDEGVENQLYFCVGGTLDGQLIEMPASCPVGAHPSGLSEIYTLREDSKFHFDPELTAQSSKIP